MSDSMPPIHLDKTRQELLEFNHNTIVCSGAGSGKTTLIVLHYLRCLEQLITSGDLEPVHRILAITFTDRAAAELRERIRQGILEKIHELRKVRDHQRVGRWQRIFRSLDHAYIGTIHANCRRLLTEFAFELQIDPAFDIMDSDESDRILSETARKLLFSGNPSTLFLFAFAGNSPIYTDFAGIPSLVSHLVNSYLTLRQSVTLFSGEKSFQKFCKSYQIPDSGGDPLGSFLHELYGCMDPDRLADLSGRDSKSVKDWNQKSRDLLGGSFIEGRETLGNFDKRVELFGLYRKLGQSKSKAVIEHFSDLNPLFQQFVYHDYRERNRDLLPAFLECFAVLDSQYNKHKSARGKLDYADLVEKFFILLADNIPVRNRLRDRFQFVVVDEAQDNDALQDRILSLLCDDRVQPTLFLVGDMKQSIYRFRGARIECFRRRLENSGEETLNRVFYIRDNFRSHQGLIDIVNRICDPLFSLLPKKFDDPDQLELLFDENHALQCTRPPNGLTGFEFLKPSFEKGISIRLAVEIQANLLASRIARAVNEKERLKWSLEGPQPCQFADFTLLLPRFTRLDAFEAAFKREGIPTRVVGGRGYFQTPEIRDILRLLRTIADPSDLFSLSCVLRSPLVGLKDKTLCLIQTGTPADLESAESSEQERFQQFHSSLLEARENAFSQGLFEFLIHVLQLFDVEARFQSSMVGEIVVCANEVGDHALLG